MIVVPPPFEAAVLLPARGGRASAIISPALYQIPSFTTKCLNTSTPYIETDLRNVIMEYALNQNITTGGLHEERERIWRISRYSNDQAHATYGFEFMRICEENPYLLIGMDLLLNEISGRFYPTLFNGSNSYNILSKRALRLLQSVEEGIAVDVMMVIPEPIRLIQRGMNEMGITSALRNRPISITLPIIDAETIVPDRNDCGDLIRAYDSHPSTGTYFSCMEYILKILGHDDLSYTIPFNNGLYRCDLAERFSQKETNCVFAGWQYHTKDLSQNDARNTGLHHIFHNENAPLKANVLLIGDSHSYSALAPMLSNAVENIRFLWASRRDNYAPFNQEMRKYVQEADFIIEEVSERFFLKNFCEEIVESESEQPLFYNRKIADGLVSTLPATAPKSAPGTVGSDKERIENYIGARLELDRAYSSFQRAIDGLPSGTLKLTEANFRVQAVQTVLSAVLSSTGWRGLDRRKFQRLIGEASRRVPNSGPAAAQHDVLLAEARRVLGLTG